MNKYLKVLSCFFLLLVFIQPASAHTPGILILTVSMILIVVAVIANILKSIFFRRSEDSNQRIFPGKIVKITIMEFILIVICLYSGLMNITIGYYYALGFGFLTYSVLAIIPNLLLFCTTDIKYREVMTRSGTIMRAFIFGLIYPSLLILLGLFYEFIL